MISGNKLCVAALLSFFLGAGKLMPPEMSGREVSQWGNLLGLPVSPLTTGGNPVLCSVPKNLLLGADAGLLMVWECNLVLGRVAGTRWESYGLYSGFIMNVIHTPVFLPQCVGSSWVSCFCSHYCSFGDGVSWTMRCSCVLLSSWQTDKGFLRSATGRRESVIFNSPFLNKRWQCVMT